MKPDDGVCWVYPGNPSHRYPDTKIDGRRNKVHRYMFAAAYGVDPGHLEVCHSCDNPRCVNPAHLFLGTHEENMRDMVRKGRQRCLTGEANRNTKLTDSQVRVLRERRDAGAKIRNLAEQFGLSAKHVSALVHGTERRAAGGPIEPTRKHKPYKNRKAA